MCFLIKCQNYFVYIHEAAKNLLKMPKIEFSAGLLFKAAFGRTMTFDSNAAGRCWASFKLGQCIQTKILLNALFWGYWPTLWHFYLIFAFFDK